MSIMFTAPFFAHLRRTSQEIKPERSLSGTFILIKQNSIDKNYLLCYILTGK